MLLSSWEKMVHDVKYVPRQNFKVLSERVFGMVKIWRNKGESLSADTGYG
jgi:hypothetical protein